MKKLRFLILALGLVGFGVSQADADLDKLQKKLSALFPGVDMDKVVPSAFPNLMEVAVGTRVVYISNDGRFLFFGNLIDTVKDVNLTENRRAELTKKVIGKVSTDRMIVIGPKNPKRHITVFTDVDCPYCAKFHRDVPALNAGGLEVRYLMFPRSGTSKKSASYRRAVSVWCADDRAKAIGIAKAGGKLPEKTCDNPVKEHYNLGQAIGIRGTPAIVMDDGRTIDGYLPAPALLSKVGLGPKQTSARAVKP